MRSSSPHHCRHPRSLGHLALAAALVLAAVGVIASPAGAQTDDPLTAPPSYPINGGYGVSDGRRTLQIVGFNGTTLTVEGSGYDTNKGIYLGLCLVPAANAKPSPCGGGNPNEGGDGGSAWVSSNPPSYAGDLAKPYGPGGSFTMVVDANPLIFPAQGLDCRQLLCALVSRNDHTRESDRSQDLFIPITFNADGTIASPAPPSDGAAPATTTTTTAPTTTTTTVPVSISPDGTTATAGDRSLRIEPARDLADGASITVTGAGYDEGQGIYVALCAVPAPGEAPSRCTSGAPEVSRWVSSNPPDYGQGVAQPYVGGGFTVTLTATAQIDAETDCRAVACAVMTRSDDTAAADRSNDLAVPVTFGPAAASTTSSTEPAPTSTTVANTASSNDDRAMLIPVGMGVLAVVIVTAAVAVTRAKRARAESPPPDDLISGDGPPA